MHFLTHAHTSRCTQWVCSTSAITTMWYNSSSSSSSHDLLSQSRHWALCARSTATQKPCLEWKSEKTWLVQLPTTSGLPFSTKQYVWLPAVVYHYTNQAKDKGLSMKYLSVDVFIYSLPGGCSGQLIRGVENPAGGEGICGASVGHTLPWEKNWRIKEGKEKKKRGEDF